MDCSPIGSSVHGILQARILEWVAMPSSRGSSPLRDQTLTCPALAGMFFTTWATCEVHLILKTKCYSEIMQLKRKLSEALLKRKKKNLTILQKIEV